MKGKRKEARQESLGNDRRSDPFAFTYLYRSHSEIVDEAVAGLRADLAEIKERKLTLNA